MDARGDDAAISASLTGAHQAKTDDQSGIAERQRVAERLVSWSGRAMMVGLAGITMIIAVVSVVARVLA